jgi:hypothetical protein
LRSSRKAHFGFRTNTRSWMRFIEFNNSKTRQSSLPNLEVQLNSKLRNKENSPSSSSRSPPPPTLLLLLRPGYVIPPHFSQYLTPTNQPMKNILHTFLNEKVSFPTSPIYINTNNAFWSTQESALLPVCRITPTNTLGVSTVLKILVGS